MIEQNYNLNTIPSASPVPIVHVSQYDKGSRTLKFKLFDGIDVFNGSTRKLSICGGDITTFGDIYVCPSFSNVSSTYNIKMVGGSSANTTVLHVKNGAAQFDGNIGFFGAYPHAKTTLTASATLSQLIFSLKNYGLV